MQNATELKRHELSAGTICLRSIPPSAPIISAPSKEGATVASDDWVDCAFTPTPPVDAAELTTGSLLSGLESIFSLFEKQLVRKLKYSFPTIFFFISQRFF